MQAPSPIFVSEKEAARLLSMHPDTLKAKRLNAVRPGIDCPPYIKLWGRTIRYDRDELLQWVALQRRPQL